MPENTLYYGDNLDILRWYIEVRYHRAHGGRAAQCRVAVGDCGAGVGF